MDKEFTEKDRHDARFILDEIRRTSEQAEQYMEALRTIKRDKLYRVDYKTWGQFYETEIPQEIREGIERLPELFGDLLEDD